jgi:hypothetical protein
MPEYTGSATYLGRGIFSFFLLQIGFSYSTLFGWFLAACFILYHHHPLQSFCTIPDNAGLEPTLITTSLSLSCRFLLEQNVAYSL